MRADDPRSVKFDPALILQSGARVSWSFEFDADVMLSVLFEAEIDAVRYMAEIEAVIDPPLDLSDCAYYRGEGICSYGCREEPACQTDEPMMGWPSVPWEVQLEFELGYPPD